jgi:transposase-like protein
VIDGLKLSFCNWKDRKPVAAELKKIYNAETAELAAKRPEDFEREPFGKKDPDHRSMLAQSLVPNTTAHPGANRCTRRSSLTL